MASHLTDFYIVGDSDCYVYAILKLRWRSSSTPEPTFLIQLVVVSFDPLAAIVSGGKGVFQVRRAALFAIVPPEQDRSKAASLQENKL
jgi:hypothetical protein